MNEQTSSPLPVEAKEEKGKEENNKSEESETILEEGVETTVVDKRPEDKKEKPVETETATTGTDFMSAISILKFAGKITRLGWGNKKIYGVMKDGFLMLHKENDKFHSWIISDGDIEAVDWVIVD